MKFSFFSGANVNLITSVLLFSKIDPNDGPTKILLDYIKSRKLKAPDGWKGVRELTSK